MTVEELNELQQQLDQGKLLDATQCAALLAEVWRLKTMNTGKAIEVRTARDESHQAGTALSEMRAENEALRLQLEQLKAINGLAACELEARWSNCAVAMLKKKGANGGTHPAGSEPRNGTSGK